MWGEQTGDERARPFAAGDHSTTTVREAFLEDETLFTWALWA
jgi:hypothetical protein